MRARPERLLLAALLACACEDTTVPAANAGAAPPPVSTPAPAAPASPTPTPTMPKPSPPPIPPTEPTPPPTVEPATCTADRSKPRSLWLQFDAAFATRGSRQPTTVAIILDGREATTLKLRAQGNPMTHQHWGQTTTPLDPCATSVTLGLRFTPLGLYEEQRVDLARGTYLVVQHDRHSGAATLEQHRTRPLYR